MTIAIAPKFSDSKIRPQRFNRRRAAAIEALEYGRAELVKLMLEGKQHHLVNQAAKDSRFKPHALLSMISRYPRKADWADGDLWRMLQVAIQAVQDNAAGMEEIDIAIVVPNQPYRTLAEIQRILRASRKPLRQIARETASVAAPSA